MDVVNIFLMISTFRGALTYSIYESNEGQIPAKDGQFPYQALIRLRYGKHYPLCNSFILNTDYVLTSAECVQFFRLSAENLEVVAGVLAADMTPSDNSHVQTSYVKEIQVHPTWYLTDGKSADIALLRVSPQFQETPFVKRAETDHVKIPSNVNVSGWGSTDDLVYMEGKVYDENTCNRLLKTELPQSVFCIGSDRGDELMSTKEFAGAGVGSENHVYGIVSSENGLATRIQSYKIWIENTMKSYKVTTELYATTENLEDESSDITDETDETEETERPTRYTTPRYPSTYSTRPFRPSTSYRPTTEEETEDPDYTDETEETDDDVTERPTRYTTPRYPSTYSTIPFRPSTSYKPTTDDETEETEESDYTDETEETDGDETERPTRYTTPRYPSTYSTRPFRPSTSYKPPTEDENEETEESDYTDETEETERPTKYTTPRYPSTYETRPFRPSTSYKPTTDNETEETEGFDHDADDDMDETNDVVEKPTSHLMPTTQSSIYSTLYSNYTSDFRTEVYTTPNDSQDTTELLNASTFSTIDPNNITIDAELFTANADDFHQEPISSGSVKYYPRSFLIFNIFILLFIYFFFTLQFS